MAYENDDWMNPQRHGGWSMADLSKSRQERPFVIQRCRRIPVSGNVSSIEQWNFWSDYATKDERDEALRKLRAEHSWKLRPASYRFDVLHVDEDEDEILARAKVIETMRAMKTKT